MNPCRMHPVFRVLQRGISLIEVMIGMAVSMLAMIIILQMFSMNAASRNSTAGGSDASQTGALAGYYINALVQEAGAGLSRAQNVWGCNLQATKSGTTLAPAASFPAPFNASPPVPTAIQVAPLIIVDGGSGSDALVSMGAASGSANRDMPSDVSVAGAVSPVMPSFGVNSGDLLLAVPQGDPPPAPLNCQVIQVGAHTVSTTNSTALGNMVTFATIDAMGFPLSATYGNISSAITAQDPTILHLGATPTFTLLGVDPTYSRLVSYSLLSNATTPTPLAENIFMLKAAYGTDATPLTTTTVDTWVLPSAAGWTATTTDLLAGTPAAASKIDSIKAVRIALVVRSSQLLPSGVTGPTSIKLFESLGAANTITRTLTASEQRYGYQVFEWVVPLRNAKYVCRKTMPCYPN